MLFRSGLIAGRLGAAEALGRSLGAPPATTALGALIAHITGGHLGHGKASFQPMNINYGLLPEMVAPRSVEGRKLGKRDRARAKKRAIADRALADLAAWSQPAALVA